MPGRQTPTTRMCSIVPSSRNLVMVSSLCPGRVVRCVPFLLVAFTGIQDDARRRALLPTHVFPLDEPAPTVCCMTCKLAHSSPPPSFGCHRPAPLMLSLLRGSLNTRLPETMTREMRTIAYRSARSDCTLCILVARDAKLCLANPDSLRAGPLLTLPTHHLRRQERKRRTV